MKNIKLLAPLLFFTVSFAPFAYASERVKITADTQTQKECPMVENVTLSLNFNSAPVSLDDIDAAMKGHRTAIDALAKSVGIDSLIVQNIGYNIYDPNPTGVNLVNGANVRTYAVNGSMTFKLDTAEQGKVFLKALSGKGYIPNLSVNAYRQCQ